MPHVLPTGEPGFPVYAVGAVYPRTAVGRRMWELARPLLMRGEEQGRAELNETRRLVGLPPLDHVHGGISRRLALVATFPQLEYPRVWPQPGARIVGPLLWEQPYDEVELPPGDEPLVLIAPEHLAGPGGTAAAGGARGLAEEPVRVIASTNRKSVTSGGASREDLAVPPNARFVEWLSYARTMPRCAAVVCHAGHGTLARALACGVPVVACPHAGDMAENSARIRWAGVGVSLPRRFQTARGVCLAVRRLLRRPLLRTASGRDPSVVRAQRRSGGSSRRLEALAARTGPRPG